MKRWFSTALALAAAAALVGCSSVKLDETPVESRTPAMTSGAGTAPGTPAPGSAAAGAGAAQSQVATVDLARSAGAGAGPADAAAGALGRVVYFDFDSFVVKDEFRGLIEGHARVLAANKNRRLLIEGHTDERGGREYNLALGQKRAEAVAKSLVLLGASDSQVEAVSYGKERPADPASTEEAWAKNRRAELKDR